MQAKILIADDNKMIRRSLKQQIQSNFPDTEIDEVESCHDLMKELVKKKYTHLILEIILSDGNTLEVIPNILRVYPDLNIMVYSIQPGSVYGDVIHQFGIRHYLSKESSEDVVIQVVSSFLNSELPQRRTDIKHADNPFRTLAPREREVLHHILKGNGTKAIAETLNLKMNTISTLKNRIYEKTNASNIKELIDLAALYNVKY